MGTSPAQLPAPSVREGRLPLAVGAALIISLNQGPVLSQVVGPKPCWPRGKHLLKQIHSCLCRPSLSGICFNFFLNLEEFKSAKQNRVTAPPHPEVQFLSIGRDERWTTFGPSVSSSHHAISVRHFLSCICKTTDIFVCNHGDTITSKNPRIKETDFLLPLSSKPQMVYEEYC